MSDLPPANSPPANLPPTNLPPAIRRADREDARHIARLALMAGEGIPGYFWNQIRKPNESVIEAGARRAAESESNFSYRNARVAVCDGEVAGLLLGYELTSVPTDEEIDSAPPFIRPVLMLERKVRGTFYINMLAIYPDYRRRGVGRALMIHAEALALSLGIDALSLEVFSENKTALDFYQCLGYRKIAELPVIPHECHPYRDKIYLVRKQL